MTRYPQRLLVQQLSRGHLERLREPLDDRHGRIPAPALDIADIGAVYAGAIGIILLAPAHCLAEATDVSTKARANIHAQLKTAMSPIDLQTISDICG